MKNEADEQRKTGAAQIAKRAQEFALWHGMVLPVPEWDNGHPMADRPMHVLRLVAAHDSAEGEFSDEALKDYPGRVGNLHVDRALRAMVEKLKASKPTQ